MHILLIKELLLASFTEEKAEAQGNAGQWLASNMVFTRKITSLKELGIRPHQTMSVCH